MALPKQSVSGGAIKVETSLMGAFEKRGDEGSPDDTVRVALFGIIQRYQRYGGDRKWS
jgi:hypothetical protein